MKNDQLEISRLPFWVQSNKSGFTDFIKNELVQNIDKSTNDEEGESLNIQRQQKIVATYLDNDSPYRGLLLYHGLGSGKTAASIFIAQGNYNKRLVVLLPASIRINYENELERFGNIKHLQLKIYIGVGYH